MIYDRYYTTFNTAPLSSVLSLERDKTVEEIDLVCTPTKGEYGIIYDWAEVNTSGELHVV